jgi:hypothetical protein
VKLVLFLRCLCGTSTVAARDVELATWSKPLQGLELWGAGAGDELGTSVAGAGDVNGDGFQDIIIGAPGVDGALNSNAGAVYLLFGSSIRSSSVIDTTTAMAPKGIKISGASTNDFWGWSVSGAGDFNLDGFDDIVIGTAAADPFTRTDAGAAVVIFGKASGWADIDLSASFTSGSAGFWLYGAGVEDQFGRPVSAAGDVNGDGAGDLVIGAALADPLGRLTAGTTYVIFGNRTATSFSGTDLGTFTSGRAGFRIFGATAGDTSGNKVSGAGDVNSDGYGDVIVGAPYYDGPTSRTDCGAAYVIFGHSTATAFTDIDLALLTISQGFRITGADVDGHLGWFVSSAGDFNNDGYDDIMVGSQVNKVLVLYGRAAPISVDLASFTPGASGFYVVGNGWGYGGFGYAGAGGGDINGDGISDIVVGAPLADIQDVGNDAGMVCVLYGRPSASFSTVDLTLGVPGVSGYRILGAVALDQTGCSVDVVGDFDGDGMADIVVGGLKAGHPGRSDAGTAYLIFGELSAPTSQPSRQPTGQPSRQPTRQPTSQPSRQPSARPTSSPVSERSGDVNLGSWSKPAQGLEVWGAAVNDNAGYSVADAGDVNKDGYHDILVGAYLADLPGKADAGAVYVVFGSPGRSTVTIDTATAILPTEIKIIGAAAGDRWGASISGAGDINKDGIDDFIVGGHGFDAASSVRPGAGAAVVIYGKTSGWADIDLASFTSGSAGFWIIGAAAGDTCGIAVSGAGDVNGDGADDVIVGCDWASPFGRSGSGASYVVFGHSAAFATIDLSAFISGTAGFKISGAAASDNSGISVAGARDFNGDGYGDVLLGSFRFDGPGGRTDCGAAYVIFGHSTATAFTDVDLAALSSSQGFRITGAAANDQMGYSVSSAGDFNYDGYDDIVIGSLTNKACVLFGRSTPNTFTDVDLAMPEASGACLTVSGSGYLGLSVSGGADVNGDRTDDIVIAAPGDSSSSTGVAYVLYGRSQLQWANIDIVSGLPSVSGYCIIGAGAASAGSWSVALVRDFDGDGVGDIAVGTPYGDPAGRVDAGTVYLVYGELSAPTSQPSRQPTSHPSVHPSRQPTSRPSVHPTRQPTGQPSRQPTSQPSRQPTVRPTSSPVSERSGDVDLATWTKPGQGLEVWGATANDRLGSAVGSGDFNNDGYQDILVGSFAADVSGRVDAGAVYLVFGSPSRSTSVVDTASAVTPKGIKISGAFDNDWWGAAVGGVGDFSKDGIDDFIVGGFQYDPLLRASAGGAVVIFGKTSGWADIDLANFTSGSAGFWIYGAAAVDQCGADVRGAGDVNGDGADDLVIGAYAADPLGRPGAGTSYVLFGHSAATTFSTIDLATFSSGSTGFMILGAAAGDGSGTLGSAGDMNGDGYGDLIVSSIWYDGGGRTDCGAAYVIFGHSAIAAFTDVDLALLTSVQGFRITGAAVNDRLGWSVSGAGDFNHDGYDDVVIGSQANKAYVIFGHTNAAPFLHVNLSMPLATNAGFVILGSGSVGYSVSGGVDVNRDGVDDIVVTAPVFSGIGVIYVLYGSQRPFADINLQSGLHSVQGFRILGAAPSMLDKWAVNLVKDFDGDGVGDILVGAQLGDLVARNDAGIAYLVYGELSAPTSQPSRQPTELPSRQPTSQPTKQPASQPSARPSRQPTGQPSGRPTSQPNVQPSRQPTSHPSKQPTSQPSRQPSTRPTSSPVSERSGDVDLATWTKPGQGLEVWGTLAGDNAGYSVAGAGDVNKDGYQDVLVGSVNADLPGKTDAGAVYVVFGSSSRLTSTLDTANAMSPNGIKITGASAGDYWGNSVSGAGDFNKDGTDDFIIGGYYFDPPSRTNGGGAVVIFGKTSGWVDIDLASFTSGSAGFWIWGAAAGDQCGNSVRAAGDVNRDGAEDLIIGCGWANPFGRTQGGTSYIIFGHNTAFATIDLYAFNSGNIGFRILGATANDLSGYGVSGAGDLNGDGYGDLVVGAVHYDGPNDRTDCGAAYVIFGHNAAATAFTDIDLAALNSSQGFRITGARGWHYLGGSVSSAGDFNHDGYDDILLGSFSSKAYVLFGHSNVSAFPPVDLAIFASGSAGFIVTGSGGLGSSVGGGIDVNRDGVDDIVLAAPTYSSSGAAYVLYGRSQLLFTNINVEDGLPGVSGYRILGAGAAGSGSWSVSLVKDFDGDSVGGVVVGSPNADPFNRADAGVAYLIYGELSAPTSQPSWQPTGQPSRQPILQPTRQPTSQPSARPTTQPTRQPSMQPSGRPTSLPSMRPTSQPSALPSVQPTRRPTMQPSSYPSGQPTVQPSSQPSAQPSRQPVAAPTAQPSSQPSCQPTCQPAAHPSCQPTRQPTAFPSSQPTSQPSHIPTKQPSSQPTQQPASAPSSQPSSQPSAQPSKQPTTQPSCVPTSQPSLQPTLRPTSGPTGVPSAQPSCAPSAQPTTVPSAGPTLQPTSLPTVQPSQQPSALPSSTPSCAPTCQSTCSPSTQPSGVPTGKPSRFPTGQPSCVPSGQPTSHPSAQPSMQPSQQPFGAPSAQPSRRPTEQPSSPPSVQPSSLPSAQPSQVPSSQPSNQPTLQPTMQPSNQPSRVPTRQPTSQPSVLPSQGPTAQPNCSPTSQPTGLPSPQPSRTPSHQPTAQPSSRPSQQPSGVPSRQPTSQPSGQPACTPTVQPSAQPSRQPTCKPSTQPSSAPTKVVVSSASLGCSLSVLATGRTFAAVEVVLRGARDGTVSLYAVKAVAGSSQPAVATAAALQLATDYTARITSQRPAVVNVSSLLPFTNYDLYCAATSSQGITMPPTAVLATNQPLRTKCCKQVTVTVQHPATVNVGQELARAVTIVLDASPSASVAVTVQYAARDQSSAGVQLLPPSLRYDNRSAVGTSKDVKLTALGAGNYTLVVSVTGPSADEYRVVYAGSQRLGVLSADATPAVPQVLQVSFSNDGSYVILNFDSATDRGSLYGTFSCRSLLRFMGYNSAQCQWFSDSQLRIYPAVGAAVRSALEVGGNVTLLANAVRAKCTDAQRAARFCASNVPTASTAVVVTAPAAPATPTVVISAPSAIGGCNSLTLDLAGSVGAAGRSWATVAFSVSTTPASTSAADQLLQFLSRNYTLSPPLSVPSAVLAKGYTYSIKATLCNFLNACGSATKVVSVAESIAPVPVVTIAGQSVRAVYRADPLSVVADAYTQSCSGSKSSAGLQYTWAVMQLLPGATSFTNATWRTTSQNPTVLKLPAYTLSIEATYTLTVTAWSSASGQRSSAAVQLKVLQSDLAAVLKGGSTRYAMVGEVVTLDASGSYDKDYPQQILSGATVSYVWQCLTVAPVLSPACAVTLWEANPGRSSATNVTSTYTALNTTTVVSVTVSDASRSSTAQVRIIILEAPSPRLSISVAGPTENINTGKPFALLGSLYLLAPCTAAWSVDDPAIALSTAARTPVQQFTLPAPGTAAIPFNLVIKGDALPQRATLQFTLSCGSTAVSTTVTTNGAPLPGSFSVLPASGTELLTTFTFAAAQWSDPDLPLTYQFGFQSAVSLSNLVIVSRSELSYATSSLPAGDASRASAVDCSLRIYDNLGAFADKAAVVFVTTQDDVDQARELVLELLRSSADSVQGVKTALAVGSSVINAANCTLAPNCWALNRRLCRMTSGQCGTCLDGFAGDAGDRNTLCVAVTAPPALLAATKSCANSCSQHGQCIFVSKTTGDPVKECTLADTDCDATCACADDYSGGFCEIDPVTLRRRREVRSNLIFSLSNLTAQEDINTESIASWSANLYALSIRPHEVSQMDAAVLADIANITLHHAIALGVDSYADMLGVLQATDAVASLQRYNYNPNDYRDADFNTSRSNVNNTAARFVPVVNTFGDMVSKLMVLGENETTLVYDNFRMTVALAAGSRIQEPHSVHADKQQSVSAASTVTLQTLTGSATPALAIKVMSTQPRSYSANTSRYVSSPVRLQVQTLESQHSSAAEYLSSIEFTFQHNAPQLQYVGYEVRNFTSTCTARNASQTFIYRCADSGHVIRHNCSQGVGVHVSYCPKPAAACAMLALGTAAITASDACVVLNSTASHTTCRCFVSSAAGDKRKLRSLATTEQQILDATGATDMLATTVYIASDFADTFNAAGALNNATLSSVLVVVLLLGSVWMAGLSVLFLEWALYKWNPVKEKIVKASDGLQSILAYIDSVIPKVFERGSSSVRRFVMEVTEHHVLFQLVTADTPAERWFLMMQALTELTLLFFLTAAFFDISQPGDDGTCAHYTTADSCLQRVCPFDYSQTYCTWVVVGIDGSEGQCTYNQQKMSTTALFYMTVLTTVISSIVSIPIEYQFATLKAPTATSLEGSKVSAVVDTVVSGARRVSNAGLAFFEPARVAPTPSPSSSPKSGAGRGMSFRFLQPVDGVVANREIPAAIAEVSTAARASLQVISRNASTMALGAEGASRALRSRSTRIARRSTTAVGGGALVKGDGAGLRLAEPTALSSAGCDDGEGADLLMQDIVHQRLLMNSSAKETKLYDVHWGLMSDGAGTYTVHPDAVNCIEAAVKESSKEATRLDNVLSNYSLQHAGLEMLHLFMLDLLGRNTIAAKIFREKFGEEFGHSRVVVLWQKFFAAAALLALNAFFIYFVMIKGVQKGRDWQVQYVACCIIQVGVDILLFETVECAWLNFLVPQYVHEEVAGAAEKLRSLTQRVAGVRTDIEETQQGQEVTKSFLNAPAHLFVSTKLAKRKPQLLESMVVGTYMHHLPGEICKTWPHCSMTEVAQRPIQIRTWLSLLRWVLRGLTLSLQLFIGVPFAYQKVALRFAQPVVFSGLALVIYSIFTSIAGQVVVAMCGLAAVVYAVRRWWCGTGSAGNTVTPTTADGAEEPTFINDASSSDNSDEVSSEDPDSAEEGSDEIEFWNVEYEYGSDAGANSTADSECSLDLSTESSDNAELHGEMEEGDFSGYGKSEDSEDSGWEESEEQPAVHGSDSQVHALHSDTGTGRGSVPSAEPGRWNSDDGSEESRDERVTESDDSVGSVHSKLHELRSGSGSGTEGALPSEHGSLEDESYREVEHRCSDDESSECVEEDSW